MEAGIQPDYKLVTVTCACGNKFETHAVLDRESLSLEICGNCHPFYTGQQKIVDTAGRVDRFQQRYAKKESASDNERA